MIYDSEHKTGIDIVGGKAFNFMHLSGNDVNIPDWFVLSTQAFFDFLGEDKENYIRLLKEYNDENRKKIISLIEKRDFSDSAKKQILLKIESVFDKTDLLAVRSSAVDEDSEKHSFAGMMESFLNVEQNEDVFKYIKKCYISCFSERIFRYRIKNNLTHQNIGVAVIIQKMISPDFSGVIFTTNPKTNNPDECLVSVVKGIGEKLVSGEENSTDYIVDNMGNVTKKSDGEICLNEKLIQNLVLEALKIEKSYVPRVAKDIEFCIKDNTIYILQCRTVTTYSFADKNKFRTILDNSNIIESYSGVTTPLTFTFAKEVYSKIYRQTLKSFYVSEESINSIAEDLDNMLAFFENKIYYRLNSWYKMTALYPGYNKNKKYMENMMGVKVSLNENKIHAKTRTLRIYASLLLKFLFMKKHSKKFIDKFSSVTKYLYANKFEGFSDGELIEAYETLEREILNDFITPIANDMGAMVFYGILADKLKKKNIPDYEGLISSVMSKQGDVESAQQSKMLLEIVEKIRKDDTALSAFQKDNLYIGGMLDSEIPVFKDIQEYIYRYGARTMDELKLETVTLFENPAFLFDMIKAYLKKDAVLEAVTKAHCENSEKKLLSCFCGIEKFFVKKLVSVTKYFVRNRESLRLRRTYVYSIVRNIYLRMGENFANEGIIRKKRDIFFLTKDELTNIATGKHFDREKVQKIIDKRKEEYETNKTKTIYERMYFYGDINSENVLPVYSEQECSDDDVLHGVAGGGKVVEGTVRFVEEPTGADVQGFILMAKRTDPGWTVIFPMADAIIIERGSVLSHSAVVAREMGLTLVVGIRGLTDRIKDGMKVRVDGVNGTVQVIEDEKQ